MQAPPRMERLREKRGQYAGASLVVRCAAHPSHQDTGRGGEIQQSAADLLPRLKERRVNGPLFSLRTSDECNSGCT